MSIRQAVESVVSFAEGIQTDIQKINDGFRSERQLALALRIAGLVSLVLAAYVGAPAVFAFLSGQPGAGSWVLFGVVSLLAGHDAIVIGKNQSFILNPLDSPGSVWDKFKKTIGMAADVIVKENMPLQYHGTWVVEPVWAATHRST